MPRGSLSFAHADVPPSPDISHPEFCPVDVPPSPDISPPEFCLADVPPSPDISHPEFYPANVPPSPDISHLTPDGRGGRFNFPGQTCPDPLIALTRRVFFRSSGSQQSNASNGARFGVEIRELQPLEADHSKLKAECCTTAKSAFGCENVVLLLRKLHSVAVFS